MKYICVEWLHSFDNEPIKIYSEIDDSRYEIRKVELFRNGRYGYSDVNVEINGTGLGKIPFPNELNEINNDCQFYAKEITSKEFEYIWNIAKNKI